MTVGSGLKDHFWTVPKLLSYKRLTLGAEKKGTNDLDPEKKIDSKLYSTYSNMTKTQWQSLCHSVCNRS